MEGFEYKSKDELATVLAEFLTYHTNFSPLGLAQYLTEKSFTRREKAKMIAPTYIEGRKFEHIYHCSACNGIPYGGIGEDVHFCALCGAEIEEIVNGKQSN